VFNPYYLDMKLLRDGIVGFAPRIEGRLLDVGCGERPYQPLFTNVTRYVGVEHLGAVQNIEPSLEHSVGHVAHLIDTFGEGENLPFRDGTFDSALCVEVLEHVPDPSRVVAEIRRVLKIGGALLVTVPFVGELHQIPFDFRRFTRFGLVSLLESNGFEVTELVTRGNFAVTAGRVLAHSIYRLGARELKNDGSIALSRLAMPLVLPLCALVQVVFGFFGRFSRDESLCLGYVAVARRAS